MTKRWLTLVSLTALGAAFFALSACGDGSDPESSATNTPSKATATRPANEVAARIAGTSYPLNTAKGTRIGNPDAKVVLEIFEDFQCPFCLRFTANVEPGIVNDFVKTGKVQLVFRQFPILGAESINAAIASTCAAEQNKFWPYHKALFLAQANAGQAENEKLNVGRFSEAKLKEIADEVKLNRTEFDACLTGSGVSDVVTADVRSAAGFGLRGTPGFVINGEALPGGSPADNAGWKKLLDDKLAGR